MSMDAKELMFGDWVKSKSDDKYYQIDSIIQLSDGSILCAVKDDLSHEYMFEPIPLTKDILLNNGFKQVSGVCKYVIDERFDFIGVGLFKSYTTFTHEKYCVNRDDPDEMEYAQDLEFDHCLYVHEFQHLLRLCGIDKEIVLE